MRIKNLSIPKGIAQTQGFEQINLTRLGEVVALVGRNGSGKSGFLKILKEKIRNLDHVEVLAKDIDFLPVQIKLPKTTPLQKNYLDNYIDAEKVKLGINKSVSQAFVPNDAYRRLEADMESFRSNFINNHAVGLFDLVKEIEAPSFLSIKNVNNEQYRNAIESGRYDQGKDLELVKESALNYFESLKHFLVFQFNMEGGDMSSLEKTNVFSKYISLKGYIRDFLSLDLTWSIDSKNINMSGSSGINGIRGKWLLNGREFNYEELSPGQRILLAYSFTFFLLDQTSEGSLRESIIIIDEPELHLHPRFEIEIIRGIRKVIKDKGQLWIATHSLSILSDLNYDEIYLIKDHKIILPNRQIPGKSLLELMELEESVERLQHFVSDVSNWAYLGFTVQCLNNPAIIESAQDGDPQVEQFINALREGNNKGVLLDYGAGKGRLFKELIKDVELNKKLQYSALEPYIDNHEDLKTAGVSSIFTDYKNLPKESFDFVILCNVLHEIKISEWELNLNSIIESLKPKGYVVLIEDQAMPSGEKIEEAGFLILDQQAIQNLFSMQDLPSLVNPVSRNDDRFLCALINKSLIGTISKDSIKNALISLELTTFKKIKDIKASTPDEKDKLAVGRQLAFYSQLCLNAKHGLEILSSKLDGLHVPADGGGGGIIAN